MIGLLQGAFADLDDVAKIFSYLVQKFTPDCTLSEEQAVERILIVGALFGKSLERL